MLFLHAGFPFTENDVEAISFVNVSFKPPNNIGFMGLGFKAAYEVCPCPQIYSPPYHFLFDDTTDGGQLFPKLIAPRRREAISDSFSTLFRLPLKDDRIPQVRRELEEFDGTSLLYIGLEKLETGTTVFTVHDLESGDLGSGSRWKIVRLDEDKGETHTFLLVIRSFGPSDEAAKEFAENRGTDDPGAYIGREQEVTLTVELLEDRSPKTERSGKLQVYLPTGIELKYPFDLQGNFIIDASRQQLRNKSGPWNSEHFAQVGFLLADLLDYSRHRAEEGAKGWEKFYDLVLDDFGFFGSNAEDNFSQQLEERRLVPVMSEEGELGFVAPDEARYVEPALEKVVLVADLSSLANIQPLWPNLRKTAKGWLNEHVQSFSAKLFIEQLQRSDWEKHISVFADGLETPIARRQIIRVLEYLLDHQYYYHGDLQNCRVILTENGTLRTANEDDTRPVRSLPLSEVDFPLEELKQNFELVHPDLLHDLRNPNEADIDDRMAKRALDTLLRLAPELTPDQIAQDVISKAFENWREIPDERLIRYTWFLVEHQDEISPAELDVKVLVKGGERQYVDPSEVYFGKEYTRNGQRLEELCGDEAGVYYLSDAYLNQCPHPDQSTWVQFFRSTGITDLPRLSKKSKAFKYYRTELLHKLREEAENPNLDPVDPRASLYGGIPADSWELNDHELDKAITTCVRRLYKEKPIGWRDRLRAFAGLIEAGWVAKYEKYTHKVLRFYYYGTRNLHREEQPALTSLGHLFREEPWVPVRDHDDLAKLPRKLVLFTKENRTLAGKNSLFSAYDFSDESLIRFLGIQLRPAEAGPLSHLRYLVETGSEEVEEFRSTYQNIAQDRTPTDQKLRGVFHKEELIYILDSSEAYLPLSRVLYRKNSALSSYFTPIADIYPDLEDFFVERLGMDREEEVEHYVRFLREYAWVQKPPMSDEVRSGLETCYRGLLNCLNEHPGDEAFEKLAEQMGEPCFVFCGDQDSWTRTSRQFPGIWLVIYPDTQQYLEQVKEKVPVESHVRRLGQSLIDLEPLIKLLGLTPLSSALDERPDFEGVRVSENSTILRDHFVVLFKVLGEIWKKWEQSARGVVPFREHWEKIEPNVAEVEFRHAQRINVIAKLKPRDIFVFEGEKRAFIENSKGLRIYLAGEVLEVYDVLADQLHSLLRIDLLPPQLRTELGALINGNVARLGDQCFKSALRDMLEERGFLSNSLVKLLGETTVTSGNGEGSSTSGDGSNGQGGGGGGGGAVGKVAEVVAVEQWEGVEEVEEMAVENQPRRTF